ncbi:2-oxo acid dehydrogenase subunit E2 [Paeniglutamicibacter psychrophenolicus]|uniref:Dihydrolipoamide acetyltransferase component of pyruvate dehydrogenase complex n=1 Tax=Paeniglutamicibacter psychrophenolicus TaxID=257454 RepID=A0ABS4WCF5_9MICC|nr:dihydrolipoamide acetyltransferase family protein [Paeniglutamicibacter psychrophenolicus]MBP2373887.1 pyruvate dehydrogenase E2 component (dihydrolipoamide acetyltransferase) [Paeniglutamicibacter psychrophenolicus]
MSVKTFLLPDLGEGLTEAELVKWLVAVGDTIVIDQPVAEVETAKSMVEVPSPYAGTVHELHGTVGEMVLVDSPLFSVLEEGAMAPAAPAAEPKASIPEREVAQSYREEERAGAKAPASEGSGNVLIGYGTPEGLSAKARKRRPRTGAGTAPATAIGVTAAAAPRRAPLVISPLVRKLARDHGIDIATLNGSGAGGLVLRSDVEAAATATAAPVARTAAPVAEPARVAVPAAAAASAVEGGIDARSGLGISSRTPINGVRKTIAQAMSRSRSEIPEATVWVDVDATNLLQMRSAMKSTNPENTPGLLAFIARFVVAGLQKYPALNTRIEHNEQGEAEIIGFDGINLGIAAQTERGLMVPSIRNAQQLSARGLNAELARLTEVTRSGKATVAELTSGTFTLNNYGVFGVDGSAAIINYPEVAILGVGRIIDKPWVVGGELAVRKVTELTLAFDHRVCDGATAAGFLRFVADAMENPASVLADL